MLMENYCGSYLVGSSRWKIMTQSYCLTTTGMNINQAREEDRNQEVKIKTTKSKFCGEEFIKFVILYPDFQQFELERWED